MPWDERTRMDERVRFVADLSSCYYTMTELCLRYGISRRTGYKWAQRYAEEGPAGLADRSRAPHTSPSRTEEACEEALVAARRERPHWGPRKLLEVLRRRHPQWRWPSVSTAGAILKRHGLVEARRRSRGVVELPKRSFEASSPNELWTADFKGEFRLGDGELCYPLTVADRCSRYLLDCRGRRSTAHDPVRAAFAELFAEYGLPQGILTDNGVPFASPCSPHRLSRLSVWWIKLGIEPLLIQPAKPQQNGSHERMHRTLKAETARPPAVDAAAQQRAFDRFRREYNDERPHEALGMKTPSQLYRPSPRPYPKRLEDWSYPGHFELRRVRGSGEVKWRSVHLFLSQVLAGETIGLEEIDDGLWSVYFGPVLLGRLDEAAGAFDLVGAKP